jgi:drug/metabolite transporter (DMT)-like permease
MILFGIAPRHITAPEVNMVILLEMLFGPVWVWAVLQEAPPAATVAGGLGLLVVLSIHFLRAMRAARIPARPC